MYTIILLSMLQFVFAGPCETIAISGTQMELVDFGIAYSEDFKFNSKDDRLELYNGVCIRRETADVWQLEADSIVIDNASVELELNASIVVFQFEGWTLNAESLTSGKELFQFEGVTLEKLDMKIKATNLKLDLSTDEFLLSEVSAFYRDELQISGQRMNVLDDKIVFKDAFVTTCLCEANHLYDVRSPVIVYDDSNNTVTLSEAELAIGNALIPLGDNYSFTNTVNLQLPTPFLDYSGDLELALRNIALVAGAAIDIGAQGVDMENEFNPYALLKLNLNETTTPGLGGNLSGVLGKAINGLQADLTYKKALAENIGLDVGTRNHDWASDGYLHDAFAGLSYRMLPVNNVLETGILEIVPRVFAALTSQEVASEDILAPRLGISVANNYAYGTPHQGLIRFSAVPEVIYYPSQNEFQYAVSLTPSLSIQSNGFSFNTSYSHKITNANSPFSTAADRASEARNLNLTMGFQDVTSNGNTFGLSTNTVVDFLKNSQANQSLVRTIGLNMSSTVKAWPERQLDLKPYLNAELARLITGIEDASLDDAYNKDFFQLGVDSFLADWEFGLRARFNPTVKENEEFVEVLEMGLGVPLKQGELLLKPYIGLNFASLLTEEYSFDVSSYGLSASYECCGNAGAFFKVRDGHLTTGLTLPF